MRKEHLMVDIETMGTKSYSAIMSIGALEFDINTGETGREFYINVDLKSCVDSGLKIDADTVMWWLSQNKEAKDSLFIQKKHINAALYEFSKFIGGEGYQMWGNSASFDLGILSNAYEKANLKLPWNFWNERCVRTLVSFNQEIKNMTKHPAIAHNALSDCYYQVDYCSKIWNSLKNG